IGREYLDEFIPAGGAAVKFVVAPDQAARDELRDGLRAAAEERGMLFAFADARLTKVHMIDKLFHELARQIDWDSLARAFLARLLTENGYTLPPGPGPASPRLQALAELNAVPEAQLRLEVTRWLWNLLFRD